jgi:antirestriction protein ArdC
LSLHQDKHGFASKWYGTFKQWDDLGAKVMRRPENLKPGSWGCSVIYYAQISKTKIDETGEEIEDRFPMLKQYSVFNAEQVELPENLKQLAVTDEPNSNNSFVDYSPAEDRIAATGADIRHGGNKCFYSPSGDFIQMVPKPRFQSEREYYGACLHELAHWSENRCGWKGNYPQGELRAELAASFMTAELKIPNSDDLTNVKAYLQCWLNALKNDPKYIFQASSAASKSADYVLSFSRQPNTEPSLV